MEGGWGGMKNKKGGWVEGGRGGSRVGVWVAECQQTCES